MYNTFHPFNFPYATDNFKEWAPLAFNKILGVKPSVVKDDIVYKDIYLNGDSVLIIGGGPSSCAKLDLTQYSDVWSMNKCYRLNIKFDLIAVGAGVDLQDTEFINYINLYKPQLAFEVHPKWFGVKLPATGYFQTKMYGKIGVGVRLVNLAAALGAAKISFIGFDGPAAILKGNHYFEPGKKEMPSYCNEINADSIHEEQYKFFWNYIKELYPNTEFNSIDKENRYHVWI